MRKFFKKYINNVKKYILKIILKKRAYAHIMEY